MKSYGINKSVVVSSKKELHLEEFYNLGYTVIENVINQPELTELRAELDRVYALQENEFGKENLKLINEENLARIPLGATYILPFSHQFMAAPSNEYMESNSIQVNAPAGSVIIFNSMLFHKAGYNRSTNVIRRGINHVYVKPIINQQIDLPYFLDGKYADDSFLSMLFGYQTKLSKSISEYRKLRFDKIKK